MTLKCTDGVGVTAYYWGTTEPTAASAITTTTAADLTSLQGSGLSKTGITNGTYYLGCKDAAGNWDKTSIVIRKYQVQSVLEKIAGTTGTYTSANYETSGSAATYYVKNGTSLTLASIYSIPTGAAAGTFKGYTTAAPGTTAASPSTTAPTVATNNTTVYYMWFNRSTFSVTISKPTNGTVKAETVTQTGNSKTASTSAQTLTVKYGDTVKATATPSTGYSVTWSGGYVSGTTNPVTGGAVTAAKTITGTFADTTKPSPTISGGTTQKSTGQTLTLKCTDGVGVTAYYWGTTNPTAVGSITTTTSADLTALQGSGLSKTGVTNGTYYLGCRDAAGNFNTTSIVIRKYQVQAVLETIAGTTGTYTSANYATSGSAATYYIKNGTAITLTSAYTIPTGAASGTFKGYTTAAPTTTAASPSTTNPTVATNDTTVYYMWFNRSTYKVTVTKPTNGTVKAETVTKTGNSVTASTAAAELTVKYGDTVKATATPSTGYSVTWSGGYVSGTTNPVTGAAVTAAKTITGTFADTTKPSPTISGGTTQKSTGQTLTLKCTDGVGVTAYYWGTTNPTAVGSITTTTSADLTALQGSGLSKTGVTNGTYYLGCRDAAGNFNTTSIVIRKYQVQAVLETIAGTTGTYTSANYATSGSAATYYIKNGTAITLTSAYTIPTGAASGTFKGYTTAAPTTTAASPSTTNPTVATNNTTVYYMWFNRNTYTVTVTKNANGKIVAQTVTKTGNSVTVNAGASSNGSLTVKYGDTVKATATPSTNYMLSAWSGGYVSGTTNPVTGAAVTAAKTITATFVTKPTFTETETCLKKTIKITYPSGCGSSLTCSYKKDSGSDVSVTSTTASIEFLKAGTLVAKVAGQSFSYTVTDRGPCRILSRKNGTANLSPSADSIYSMTFDSVNPFECHDNDADCLSMIVLNNTNASGNVTQHWYLEYNKTVSGKNYYYITSAYEYPSNTPNNRKFKYLEMYGQASDWTAGTAAPWADVYTSRYDTAEWNWTFEDAGNGFYYIKPQYNNSWCLDVNGNNAAVGTRVLAYTCSSGAYNQIWELLP